MLPHRMSRLLCLASLLLACFGCWAQTPAPVIEGPAWATLSASQKGALAPLAKDWNQLPADSRRKWLELATRFPGMPPAQQQRVQQRMGDWARMSPQQRSEARLNFQQSKQLSEVDRQQRWEAYQALPAQERAALAAKAPNAASGPNQPERSAQALRRAPVDAQAPKSNRVPPQPTTAPGPKAVAATVVQSSTGATTSLINSRPAPPVHQPAGRLKIDADSKQVDKTTLLPKRPTIDRTTKPVEARPAPPTPAPAASAATGDSANP